jgi:DNA polymerase-3 subunit delta'
MTDVITAAHPWPVIGHDWAVDYLRKGMFNQRVRHAYLITGTTSIGKTTLAQAFAMALNCMHEDIHARPCGECRSCKRTISGNHPDVIYSENDARTNALKIDAVRAVSNRIAMKPYDARYRVAIMPDFDQAQPRAQDALLKTLEEPPGHAVLILLTTSLEPILPTITSRSQVIYLRPVAAQIIQNTLVTQHGLETAEADLLARFSGGRIGWAIDAAQNPDILAQRTHALDLLEDLVKQNRAARFDLAQDLGKDKLALTPLLELWLTYWRDVLLLVEESPVKPVNTDREVSMQQLAYDLTPDEARSAVEATQNMLNQLSYNINLRLALEVMFLDYPGLLR